MRFPSLKIGKHISHIKLFAIKTSKNVFRVVRFHTMTLLSLDFSSNFLKSSVATHYVACSFLSACRALGGEKSP